jgi:hypothetical protein
MTWLGIPLAGMMSMYNDHVAARQKLKDGGQIGCIAEDGNNDAECIAP